MAERALVQTVPGVHVYIGAPNPPAMNMLCAGGDASRSQGRGLQNIFNTRQNGGATYTCTPGGLKCLVALRIMKSAQWIHTILYNKKCIYVYKCIYIRENEKNMPCSKKARCTCVCREMAYVHLKGAMYTWKGKNKEVGMKNGRFIALCWLVAAGGCLLGYGLAVWLAR